MSDVKIPEDVRERSEAVSQDLVDHAFAHGKLVTAYLPEFFARAILAERERCAKIAEDGWNDQTTNVGLVIAQAIRSPHE